jgi:hypothetical protein
VRYSSIFGALPGAHAPGRVHSPPRENICCLRKFVVFFVDF